jgi:hypothetical protein
VLQPLARVGQADAGAPRPSVAERPAPTPSSRTSISSWPPSCRALIQTVPGRFVGAMPWTMAFSTSDCSTSAGTAASSASRETLSIP